MFISDEFWWAHDGRDPHVKTTCHGLRYPRYPEIEAGEKPR